MRFFKHLVLLCTILAMTLVTPLVAQTARLSPSGLSRVPIGATRANPYWQRLVIELTRNVSAGQTITIELPTGVAVADTDGNGTVEDEISLDGVVGQRTGYDQVTGSTPSRIRLRALFGGRTGPVYVQFPITTPTASATTSYGSVVFSNPNEDAIPAGTVTLAVVAASEIALLGHSNHYARAAADTTTGSAGLLYPDAPAAIFANPLPDLVADANGVLGSDYLIDHGSPFANGDDSDDVTYAFWWSTTTALASLIDALPAVDASGEQVTAREGELAEVSFDVSGLDTTTYYLYTSSNLTGTFPLMRSRGIRVRRDPQILQLGSFFGNDADWIDTGRLLHRDTGIRGDHDIDSTQVTVDIPLRTVSVDSIKLYYATQPDLDSVATSGTAPNLVIDSLLVMVVSGTDTTWVGAAEVDSARAFTSTDTVVTWTVAPEFSTGFVPEGDYYVYAVGTDGDTVVRARTQATYNVRHSPWLRLDSRASRTLNTGGTAPDRYYAITWNQDSGFRGDLDRDDVATISLFYTDADTFQTPEDSGRLLAAAADSAGDTHLIVGGLGEDADGKDDNQHVWDLWTYRNPDDGGVPAEGKSYYLYGVISGGATQRLVRWSDGAGNPRTLTFTHDPYLTIRAPMTPLNIDGRRSFEVVWEATDVDADARLWVVVVPLTDGISLGEKTTWGNILAAATQAWNATSADGSLTSGEPLSEDVVTSFSVRAARLVKGLDGSDTPIADGDYSVFVVVDPAAGSTPAAASLALRAPGSIALEGFGQDQATGLAAPALELLPARSTVASRLDTSNLSVHPNSAGEDVDVVSVFLSMDTLLVSVVDQDSVLAGVQPFRVNPGLTGQTLFDSVRVGTSATGAATWELDLVYFEQSGIAFDGDTELASVLLASRNLEGTTVVHVDNSGNRRSAFYRSGDEVGGIAPDVVAEVRLLPRATLSGQVRLQGRSDHSGLATLELRDRNHYELVADTLFRSANDADTTAAGVQVRLDSSGGYALTDVPAGNWHLTAQLDRYLTGQYPNLRIDLADQLTDVNPMYLSDATVQSQFLLGGDVTGWVDDSTGVSSPDNQIDQLDIDFVTSFFGETVSDTSAGALADIDADSLVWVPDLNMVAANYGVTGVEPSYRPAAAGDDRLDAATAELDLIQTTDGGHLSLAVHGKDLPDVRAYGVTLAYDPALWRPTGHDAGHGFGARPAVEAFREEVGLIHLGAALLGASPPGLRGDAVLAEIRLQALEPAAWASVPAMIAAGLVDGQHRARSVQLSAGQPLPAGFALQPAYPNPFNPRTALRLEVPFAAVVDIGVYDVAGQRLRTLIDGPLRAGVHTVRWDGRDASGRGVGSGVYFARLLAPGFRAERKMLLLR